MKKLLLFLSFLLAFTFVKAQNPVNITQPYNFLKWIKVKDSIRATIYFQSPNDTMATKKNIRDFSSALNSVLKADSGTIYLTPYQISVLLSEKLNLSDSLIKYATSYQLSLKINASEKGQQGGVATLGPYGFIPIQQIDTSKISTTFDLFNKVDKITGKKLSTKDYSAADSLKLAGLNNDSIIHKSETENIIGKKTFISNWIRVKNYRDDAIYDHPVLNVQNSRGTIVAPTYLLLNDEVGAIAFREGTDINNAGDGNGGAGFNVVATENWTSSALGSCVNFFTTPNGSITKNIYLAVGNDGIASFLNALKAPSIITPSESYIGPSSTTGVYFKNSNVGIGTVDPLKPFHISDNTQRTAFNSTAFPIAVKNSVNASASSSLTGIVFNNLYNSVTSYAYLAVERNSSAQQDVNIHLGSYDGSVYQKYLTIKGSNGCIGINNQLPTKDLSFGGQIARAIWLERNTTTNTAGNDITLQAGGTTIGATDKNGGKVYLIPGISTGIGTSSLRLQRNSRLPTSSTSDNATMDAIIVPSEKNLVNNTATSLFSIPLSSLSTAGGSIYWTINVTDGTDLQSMSGDINYSSVNKGGIYTSNIAISSSQSALSAGTLTITPTILTGTNLITIQINANSSLTSTSMKMYYTVHNGSTLTITQL